MGDRGNIKVYQSNSADAVYLYTHSGGSGIYGVVKRTLARRERWDDGSYLTRMLFCELVKDDVGGTSGYGISTRLCDNEHTIIALNPETEEITFELESGFIKGKISFEEMVTKKDKWSE